MRCVTFNIRHAEAGLDRVAALLAGFRPDVVFLQEVDRGCARSGGADQAAILARTLGLHAAFGEAFPFDGGAYGVALLSRDALHEERSLVLPHGSGPRTPDGRNEPRIALIARMGSLTLACTHLGLDADERRAQAEALRALQSEKCLILGGDLNDAPDGPVLRSWGGWLRDAFVQAGGVEERTAPADAPPARIDFILRSDDAPSVLHAFAGPPGASDHRPVVVDVED